MCFLGEGFFGIGFVLSTNLFLVTVIKNRLTRFIFSPLPLGVTQEELTAERVQLHLLAFSSVNLICHPINSSIVLTAAL
jgi:hypothetical protein